MKATIATLMGGLLAAAVLTGCSTTQGNPNSGAIELFNGKNLKGWTAVPADSQSGPAPTWTVRDGIIVCTGEPIGFLHTDRKFTNFRMSVEYRWAPGTKPGNSGLFSRINEPLKSLPRTVEVQLMHGNAGDVITLQGMMLEKQERYFEVLNHALGGDIRGVRKVQNAEREPGEWNLVEIVAQGPEYTVWVNGQKVNNATGVEVLAGPVGLQSEGGEIHFRRVTLTPLP
jgi:hypothetical protein